MGAAAPARAPAPRRSRRARAPAQRRARAGQARARRAPARRSVPRPIPARAPTLAGAALIPTAAVRTAGAVRDLSDSSLIVRLTRGRGWIAVLCALLGGIVALNVISLSLNSGSGRISLQIEEMERANSALRAELAERLSASEVQAAAGRMGLATPEPTEIAYLKANGSDFDRLAELLSNETVLTASPAQATATAQTGAFEQASTEPSTPPSAADPPPQPPSTAAPAPSSEGGAGSGGVGL